MKGRVLLFYTTIICLSCPVIATRADEVDENFSKVAQVENSVSSDSLNDQFETSIQAEDKISSEVGSVDHIDVDVVETEIATDKEIVEDLNKNTSQSEEMKSSVAIEDVEQELIVSDKDGEVSQSEVTEKKEGFFEKYIHEHLQLGVRISHRELTDPDSGHKGGWYHSGTYLGTIYALEEKQDYAPVQFYGRYFFNKYLGVELGYDRFEAKTLVPSSNPKYSTDGDIELSGLSFSLLGYYSNKSRFSPYAGIGVGMYSTNFSEAPHWASAYEGHRRREMVVDDVQAILVTLGLECKVWEQWNIDVSTRYTGNADIDVVFNGYTGGVLDTVQSGHFPMNNWAFQVAVSYSF